VIVVLMKNPEGTASAGHELADRFAAWRSKRKSGDEGADASTATVARPAASQRVAPPADAPAVLEVQDLIVRYGGVVAVANLSLRVPAGGIVGLIGPNGAGKTSAIDAITGFARASGVVRLGDQRIEGLPAHKRVRQGLGRTFQSLELYDDLTVEENVGAATVGAKGEARHGAVARALDLVGITELRGREAGGLSQGERQLVSIARACAADPQVLLLDEPAAGLDTTESRWLGERIRNIAMTGTGVLLVDHDVALVLGICDHVYVLDFGSVIAEGDPASIRTDQAVAAAYLGTVHDSTAAAPA
jgi:sulfate-transporting ATPase